MRMKDMRFWRPRFMTARRRDSGRIYARRHSEVHQDRARRTSVRAVDRRHANLHQRAEGQGPGVHHGLLLWRLGDVGGGVQMRRAWRRRRPITAAISGRWRTGSRNARRSCHFGEHDHGIPMDVVKKVKELHPDVPVYVYDAGHGFNSDRRSRLQRSCRKLARQRTLELFQRQRRLRADLLRYCRHRR